MALTLIDTNLGADELAVLQPVMDSLQVAISRCTLMRVKTLPATPKTQPNRMRSTSNRVLVIETTGRYPYDGDSILEICALECVNGTLTGEEFIRPCGQGGGVGKDDFV